MPLGHGAFPIPLVHREQPLDDSGSSRYRHARILAQEPAQYLIAPHRSRRHDRVRARNRSPQIEPSMWSCLVAQLSSEPGESTLRISNEAFLCPNSRFAQA